MIRLRTTTAALAAIAAGSLLTASGASADSTSAPSRCAAIQHDLDAYRRGEIQYFVDPEPAWRAEAEQLGCEICGL
ncbi:hypothetical protein ACIQM4_34015 [Streptomyces sp. NPDC091272]|uniref:hypothetical protein n=1 Tax=Streptomyces sp. NPDC091272 TaxID=3365981 RepID=UPI0038118520